LVEKYIFKKLAILLIEENILTHCYAEELYLMYIQTYTIKYQLQICAITCESVPNCRTSYGKITVLDEV
jgi:hypothetical protein